MITINQVKASVTEFESNLISTMLMWIDLANKYRMAGDDMLADKVVAYIEKYYTTDAGSVE